jgi:hypothetical protein
MAEAWYAAATDKARTHGNEFYTRTRFDNCPGDDGLLSLDGRDAPTRDEGRQKLFRTEPRTSPVQSFHFRIAAQPEDPAQWKRLAAELNLPLRAEVLSSIPAPGVPPKVMVVPCIYAKPPFGGPERVLDYLGRRGRQFPRDAGHRFND